MNSPTQYSKTTLFGPFIIEGCLNRRKYFELLQYQIVPAINDAEGDYFASIAMQRCILVLMSEII